MPAGKLHILAVERVRASYQSDAMDAILPMLTEEENELFHRGRNATGNSVPKSSNPIEYRRATGLECLFGYLYLLGRKQRINELFEVIWNKDSNE